LVGMWAVFEEFHEALELRRVFRADIGRLADEVLGVLDTTHQTVNPTVAESRVDDDGADHLTGRLQQHDAAIGHICHILKRGLVVGVFLYVQKFYEFKMG